MDLSAFITAGFVGLASGSGGFDGAWPISMGAGAGAPTLGDLNAPVVRSPSVEPQAPAGPRINIPIHKPSDFPFVTIVPDDGTDKAGGWQAAKVNLEFIRVDVIPPGVTKWKCPITIQIPIRHSTMGYISPRGAAIRSATVTNSVTVGMDFELPHGIFCDRFRASVKAAFPIMYPNLGARVTR